MDKEKMTNQEIISFIASRILVLLFAVGLGGFAGFIWTLGNSVCAILAAIVFGGIGIVFVLYDISKMKSKRKNDEKEGENK
ncbi:hypothetical protein COU37_00650 [Candidatus Micrarchaeota archaeon CG10_big_fil_rev_8_21_14_0_10_45_29]|nr:MAG: hypothetical protein COU37_00650 [Candidatus Micrarchaeota archaeon CG10_big_fil_rev_8_21_14_0_10_45_29]